MQKSKTSRDIWCDICKVSMHPLMSETKDIMYIHLCMDWKEDLGFKGPSLGHSKMDVCYECENKLINGKPLYHVSGVKKSYYTF